MSQVTVSRDQEGLGNDDSFLIRLSHYQGELNIPELTEEPIAGEEGKD